MPNAPRLLIVLLAAAALTVALPGIALGHVHVESTTPEPGTNLDDPPSEVVIEFDGELDPDQSSFTVRGGDGAVVGEGEVDLSVADRNVLRGDVSISEPGIYDVEYSVVGLDGHELTGEFSFGFQATEAVPTPEPDEHPDTAVGGPTVGAALLALGTNLLLAAGLLAALGVTRRAAAERRATASRSALSFD